jgi:hypothetical protein
MNPRGRTSGGPNNHVAEWFGHRIFPTVATSDQSIEDQKRHRCPFLTRVKDTEQRCIKPETSRGVCTVSSTSNGPRQDWVVCPYRVFDPVIVDDVAARVFEVSDRSRVRTHAAPTLSEPEVQESIPAELDAGNRVLVYFDQKIGGEISLRGTARSPEVSFDVTFVELVRTASGIGLGKFAILEVQTMDFHGSYKHAVAKLMKAVDLFPDDFPIQIEQHPEWAGERIEGPNIANVVKRTFWQMFFKFNFGLAEQCAGTTLAIPAAVWDSWQPFLGMPELTPYHDGTFRLTKPGEPAPSGNIPAWIYVFDIDARAPVTPNPITLQKVIGATADALGHYALVEAPRYASDALVSSGGIYATLRRRIRDYWPDQPFA